MLSRSNKLPELTCRQPYLFNSCLTWACPLWACLPLFWERRLLWVYYFIYKKFQVIYDISDTDSAFQEYNLCIFSEYAAVLNAVHCFIIDDLQFGGR